MKFDSIVIQMQSITIFWQDIGGASGERNMHTMAIWWDEEVQPWIDVAIKGDYHPHPTGVWFADFRDARLFKLKFMGQMPR